MQRDTHPKIYEFNGFRLEEGQSRLLYQDQPVSLKPKILDLLIFLVKKRGQLVAKDELMKEIWPDAIVEENNITVSMSILRKALGDAVGNQIIETVPRRGYRFIAHVTEVVPLEALATQSQQANQIESEDEPIDSLAVIPLEAPDRDVNVEYLSDGITESIINTLSRIPKLRVLACSTVFRLDRKVVDAQKVGRELNVKAVTLIRVIRLGDNLIIRSELVRVSDGSQLWGEQYNRSPSDILAIQEEISKAITESLKLKISPPKRATSNNEAFNLYLRGRYFWNKYSKESVLKAIELFQQAIAIDENFALAYCGLADAYFRLSNVHLPPKEVLPKAKEAAVRAVEIDEDLAEAHASLGLVKVYYDYDWDGAEKEFRKALRLNPDLLLAHTRFGSYLQYMGRFEEANKHYQKALEIDPCSLQTNVNLATTYYLRSEYERAIKLLQKTSELEPGYMPTVFVLGCVYIQQGRLREAIEQFQQIYKVDEEAYLAMGFMGYALGLAGQREEAETLLNVLREISERKYVSPYSMLVIHLALGPQERVFELLQQLYNERNEWLVWLKVSPELHTIHNHPRFKELMSLVGFTA